MPGNNCNQFVNLSESEKKQLSCGICYQIYDNPLTTNCGHNFCRQCIEDCIKTKRCPECKIEFKRLRTNGSEDNKNLVVILRYGFTRNIDLQSMVNKLKIKCKFESNGCQELIDFELRSEHIKECKHRSCKICGFSEGWSPKHNCLELLKNERKELKKRYKEMKQKCIKSEHKIEAMNKEMTKLQSKLEERQNFICRLSEHLNFVTFDVNYALFGTYLSNAKAIRLYQNSISFFNFGINFKNIKKTMHCSHPSLPLLIIKVSSGLCRYIRKSNQLTNPSNGWFDVDSNDSSQKYIIVELISFEKMDIFIELLSLRLSKCEFRLNCRSIDEIKAKKLVTRARSLKTKDYIST